MMSRSAPYGVLLVTGGRTHQENYARMFAADPRCRLVALADEANVPPQRAAWNRQLAEELGLPYLPDLDAALAREDVQIASICAEHERRGRVTVQCAEAGKHVYIDKPMTCRVADADAVVAAVARAGVRSQVFSQIHTPWSEAAKRVVESGALGELTAVHCDVLFAKGHPGTAPLGAPRRQEPYPERFTFPDAKRELRAAGVYALGIVRYVTGREVRTVYGVTANYFFAEHARHGVEDFGLLAMTLEGGLTATITGGRIGWMSHPAAGPNRIHLTGTRGAVTIDACQPRLEIYSSAAPWTPPPPHPEDPMAFWQSTQEASGVRPRHTWAPLRGPGASPGDPSRFLDCLDAGRESSMSARDGAAVVEALMAGYVSASRGEVVTLPLPRGAS
jgi:myo-inositol 2-dehydrogenase / D-chiro-inositol 1-dehydrogenase